MSDVLPTAPDGAGQATCGGCGAAVVTGAAFCHTCGHPLGAAPPAPGPAGGPAPSVFDAPPAPAPSTPPGFDGGGGHGPPRGTTLPGWGEPAPPPPTTAPAPARGAPGEGQPRGQPQSAWPYAAPSRAPGASPAAPPPPRRGAGVAIAIVAAVGLGFIVVMGVLAAIAIPNFIRYQLRAKASEVPALLAQLDRAEVARRAEGESYVVFAEGLPAGQAPGAAKLTWGAEDAQAASALHWPGTNATYARYAVDGQEDEDGHQAIAMCAETDLDGDGVRAAWVAFRPALADDGSMIVPPPPAPCREGVALSDGASLEFDATRPPGTVVRLSPESVF